MTAVVAAMVLTACGGGTAKKAEETTATDAPAKTAQQAPVNATVTDTQGNSLKLTYDNEKGTATIEFDGKIIHLKRDTTASGIHLYNDEYEYQEWQGRSILYKNGDIVFDNKDHMSVVIKNKEGDKLDLLFNNNNKTAIVKFADKEIYLTADTTASGIRYSNDEYVYEEWQGHVVLKRGSKVVFDNQQ